MSRCPRNCSAVFMLALTGALACGGEDITAPPTTGTLEVTTSTIGAEPDPDGYTVRVDAHPAQAIGPAATLRIAEVAAGSHTVELAGVSANCTVSGDNPRTLSITAGETTTVAFAVTCGATTGSLEVTSSTSGPSPDTDGYTITVDGGDHGPLGVSAAVTLPGLTSGSHMVGLSGVAANCVVQGDNPRAVTITAGSSTTVAFSVTCAAPPPQVGTLRITTVTTGPDQDHDGYAFAVDGGSGQPIGVNSVASLANVAVGDHSVQLSGLASNCAVQGTNPRSVTVSVGATAELGFAVTCTAVAKTYTAVDLGTLGGIPGLMSSARAINSAGQVVGKSMIQVGDPDDRTHAFLWDKGVMTDLGTLAGCCSAATDINLAGKVVGWSAEHTDLLDAHAFLWEEGVMTDLGTLGGTFARAEAINSTDQVVGSSATIFGVSSVFHAFLWENGVMTDLGTLGGNTSQAWDINPAGQVVGYSETAGGEQHAFFWEQGAMTDLGTLGGSFSFAVAINSVGQVVGYSETPAGQTHAFLWENGMMTDLGTLGGDFSHALDINDAGQVVGRSGTSRGFEVHGFLWENGVMIDLPPLGGSSPALTRNGEAFGIDAAGQVVGASVTAVGDLHATLWIPE